RIRILLVLLGSRNQRLLFSNCTVKSPFVVQENSPSGFCLNDYSPSPSPKPSTKANPFLDEINKALGDQIETLNFPHNERDFIQENVSNTPNVPIQPTSIKGIKIDPRIQFQEKLEEAKAESVEKAIKSMKPLPSIPIIEIDSNDSYFDDLLKVIFYTKARSEHGVSNSKNKFVQQEK
ncbi:hypothetical protein PIB30_043063, partial [Stylosanthes scabra]|nr:hypothetical protein [Stylosanthes scabra]